ncbi:ribonuclease P protein component [Antarcticibacterium arcticum]|uniref:Ribonuclease P protein component n=1 Tax=Antarcticibacterium arcticum TaxID=2585771 RepID=A0A5B8YMG0_9FLAO|nr:ribonuclease P protein component [Antarcticibacterium arcticum]QED38448.1 ribonuclease P protein component [Antarcticibacterium arcticum]
MSENFPSEEKLKSKILIDRLFLEGKSVQKYPIKLIYAPIANPEITTHKTGVSVPKRNFKKAVDRNYLKRLMREAFRKNKYLVDNNLHQKYALMFIYTGRETLDYNVILAAVINILEKLTEREGNNEK